VPACVNHRQYLNSVRQSSVIDIVGESCQPAFSDVFPCHGEHFGHFPNCVEHLGNLHRELISQPVAPHVIPIASGPQVLFNLRAKDDRHAHGFFINRNLTTSHGMAASGLASAAIHIASILSITNTVSQRLFEMNC
jgi:hypothetical protein